MASGTFVTATLINGRHTDSIAVADRGFAYGDGVFETIAVRDNVPRSWSGHYARLVRGCNVLNISPPSEASLLRDIGQLPDYDKGVIKIIVTRGPGARGYTPSNDATPTRVVQLTPWPAHLDGAVQRGAHVMICQTRVAESAQLVGIKHLSRLAQVLAAQEVHQAACDEGLMQDDDGHVVTGTRTNLFIIKDSKLCTPPLARAGVHGVMRAALMQAIKAKKATIALNLVQRELTLDDVFDAEEIFLTNSLVGVWPVATLIDDQRACALRSDQGRRIAQLLTQDDFSA